MQITLEHVHRALKLPDFDAASAQSQMAPRPRPMRRPDKPGQPRLGGVLILLYPDQGKLSFPLMRRTEDSTPHSGQISLPGGKHEVGETIDQTAIRETHEELGISDTIQMIGPLSRLYVPPSDFDIHPFVGTVPARPEWHPSADEVAGLIEVPLPDLLDDRYKKTEVWTRNEAPFHVPMYTFEDNKVWGATAAMLSEFEARLRAVL